MPTIATVFSGGEGVGCGARAAGLDHLWGIEYDDDIAQVARNNGFDVKTCDVTKVDPSKLEKPDVLHASPPCPNFSVANVGGKETDKDIRLALATCRFIEALRPKVFTFENVYLYRKSQSWLEIAQMLKHLGYGFCYWHLCAADYGVPQTRRRMVVIARRDGQVPQCPPATHAPADEIAPMFDERKPWVGWYEAIEDLIPALPGSEFANFQKEYIGEMDGLDFLVSNRSTNTSVLTSQPSFTIAVANGGQIRFRIGDEVKKLSSKALARLQSFPNSYKLPESKTLAHKVIGNAVPPLMYQRIVNSI